MAKGSRMLQIEVEQIIQPEVSEAPEIWAVALDYLDGDTTTVREIATEKSQVLLLREVADTDLGWLDFSSASALTDLFLVFPDLRRPPTILHAPSHVSSPPVNGALTVVLRVRDFFFGFEPRALKFVLGRRIGSHAYLDEVPPRRDLTSPSATVEGG